MTRRNLNPARDHREAFRRVYVAAKLARRSQFTISGEAAIAFLAHDELTLQHSISIAQGYRIGNVPCRLLSGHGFTVTFTYRHDDSKLPTIVLRFIARDRRPRRSRSRRR